LRHAALVFFKTFQVVGTAQHLPRVRLKRGDPQDRRLERQRLSCGANRAAAAGRFMSVPNRDQQVGLVQHDTAGKRVGLGRRRPFAVKLECCDAATLAGSLQ